MLELPLLRPDTLLRRIGDRRRAVRAAMGGVPLLLPSAHPGLGPVKGSTHPVWKQAGGTPCRFSQLSHYRTVRTFFPEFSSSRAFMNSLPFPFGLRTSQKSPGRARAIRSVLTSHHPPHRSGVQSTYKSTKGIKATVKSTARLKTQGPWGHLPDICSPLCLFLSVCTPEVSCQTVWTLWVAVPAPP